MLKHLHEKPFYNAIFLADPLDNKIRERVSNLGISHLVAISGFHLGILWIVIFGTLYLPYKFLQQFQFLIFVLLVILAVMPKLITSVALLLSFMGVYYIFLILKWLKGYSTWFISLVAIPIGVFLLMFPIGHFFFNNTTIWQLMSPILSLLFIIFYPIVAILHLFGVGGIFDNSLMNLFNLPTKSIKVIMPLWIILPYIALSIVAISKKRAFYTTLIFATLITKNEQENLSKSELLAFKTLSKDILDQSNDNIKKAIKQGVFIPLGGKK